MAARRGKWHPPPPPTPKILHFPRRSRSRRPRTTTTTITTTININNNNNNKTKSASAATGVVPHLKTTPPREHTTMPSGRLERLFEQERCPSSERRARVAEEPSGSTTTTLASSRPAASAGDSEEEKWRFQAEILRAECSFLRMEREVALKEVERNRTKAEAALRSAIEVILSGSRSQSVGAAVLQELEGKLESLQRSCAGRVKKNEAEMGWRRRFHSSNFDKKAMLLRRRLQEMNVREMMPKRRGRREEEEEEVCVREIREIAPLEPRNAPAAMDRNSSRLPEVEKLRKKMEGISKGMLDSVEQYRSLLLSCSSSSSAAAAVSASAVTPTTGNQSSTRIDAAAMGGKASTRGYQQLNKEEDGVKGEEGGEEEEECSGKCKEVVARIVEQVKAETEQWSEMQAMLDQIREEMEDLRCSRDFWERCAIKSDEKLRTISSQTMEWRHRARESDQRAVELQKQVFELKAELEQMREDALPKPAPTSVYSYASSIKSRGSTSVSDRAGGARRSARLSASPCELHNEKEKVKEKRVLFCRFLDENSFAFRANTTPSRPPPPPPPPLRRVPFREIGNVNASLSPVSKPA